MTRRHSQWRVADRPHISRVIHDNPIVLLPPHLSSTLVSCFRCHRHARALVPNFASMHDQTVCVRTDTLTDANHAGQSRPSMLHTNGANEVRSTMPSLCVPSILTPPASRPPALRYMQTGVSVLVPIHYVCNSVLAKPAGRRAYESYCNIAARVRWPSRRTPTDDDFIDRDHRGVLSGKKFHSVKSSIGNLSVW